MRNVLLSVLLLLLLGIASAQMGANYEVIANQDGSAFVLATFSGQGALEVSIPADVAAPYVKGALYTKSGSRITLSLTEDRMATVSYRTEKLAIKNGERVKVASIRGEVEAVAMVTPRIRPFKIGGKTIHQVAMPYAFGWLMPKSEKNYSTNLLTPAVGDANTMCPEYKGFMVNVKKV